MTRLPKWTQKVQFTDRDWCTQMATYHEALRIAWEALENMGKAPHIEYDEEHSSWGNFDDSYLHGSRVSDSETADKAKEALRQIEALGNPSGGEERK